MALDNFKPILWNDGVMQAYDKALVFGALANREYEGQISGLGSSVKVSQIGDLTLNTYSGSVTYEELSDAARTLYIDQPKYAAFKIDDVDNAQTNPKLFAEATRKLGLALAGGPDVYISGLYTQAGVTSGLGTTGSPISITSANVITYLSLINKLFDENNVPMGNRVMVVPPWFVQKLVLAKITKDTDNSAVLTGGYVGNLMGIDFYMSNNVTKSGTTWYAAMAFERGETIAMASQLDGGVEAMRLESAFGTGVRGLMLYGAKVMRPESLAALICAEGAES